MLTVRIVLVALIVSALLAFRRQTRGRGAAIRRNGIAAVAFTSAAALLVAANTANAAIVPTVPLLSAANYSVIGADDGHEHRPERAEQQLGAVAGTDDGGRGSRRESSPRPRSSTPPPRPRRRPSST